MGLKELTIADVKGGIGMVGENVPKTMNGQKTQTRRIESSLLGASEYLEYSLKMADDSGGTFFNLSGGEPGVGIVEFVTPKLQPGSVYYVKEALERWGDGTNHAQPQARYKSDSLLVKGIDGFGFRAWTRDDGTHWKPKVIPAIYMPRSAARTFIEIVDVNCERLHDITIEDIKAEGVKFVEGSLCLGCSKPLIYRQFGDENMLECETPGCEYGFVQVNDQDDMLRLRWRQLWDQCNGKGAWKLNPRVFAYEFKTVEVMR